MIGGIPVKEVAAELHLSRHTVHDHVKVIYNKCGVTSRSELVAKLFSQNAFGADQIATSVSLPVVAPTGRLQKAST
jgi:hypothetical protein